MNNIKIYVALGVVAIIAILGLNYPHSVQQLAGASAVGTTQSTPRQVLIVMSPTTPAATSTSILNSDSNDRIIESAKYECTGIGSSFTYLTGAGLASTGLILNAATTSVANTGSQGNTNLVFDNSNTVATTSPTLAFISSSTPGTIGANVTNRVWASGSYLTFTTNATNTAVCTVGVSYIPS